jgi:hypothetical protein
MKMKDKFGYYIPEDIYENMIRYSEKLIRIGFKESKNKPSLFYFTFDYGAVFADMRGYNDKFGRFLPIWSEERKGAPRFYQMIEGYDEKKTGKINRGLWEVYHLINKTRIPSFYIGPFVGLESSWYYKKIPKPQFFLENSENTIIPLVVEDFVEPGLYYSGYCLKCRVKIDGENLFCNDCRKKIPPNFYSNLRNLVNDNYFHQYPSKNSSSFIKYPLEDFTKELAETIRIRRFKQDFGRLKKNICVLCGQHRKSTVEHHITYHPQKFMTLCRSCHRIIHTCSFPNPYWKERKKKKPRIKCVYCGRNHTIKETAQKHRVIHVIETLKKIADNCFIKLNKSQKLETRIRLNKKVMKYRLKILEIKESLSPKDQQKISQILSHTIIDENRLTKKSHYKDLTDFMK